MHQHFAVLDGWRGLSILLVLFGHLAPLGPSAWQLNAVASRSGMVLFFILSGFLITTSLIKGENLTAFLIKRMARIIPLIWLSIGVLWIWQTPTQHQILSNLFFYANFEPIGLIEQASHFWSLSIEIQFYLSAPLLILIFKKHAILLIPIIGIFITLFRVINSVEISINSYYRADEIIAGATLAIVFWRNKKLLSNLMSYVPFSLLIIMLFASGHPSLDIMNYLRPYIAALLVAKTLFLDTHSNIKILLESKFLKYCAAVSFAVYVFHGILRFTWLGSGDVIEKYLKRPILICVTFLLAHFSTFYYERFFNDLGKRLASQPSLTKNRNSLQHDLLPSKTRNIKK